MDLKARERAQSFEPVRPKSVRKLRETWKPFVEATLGFREHWYPVGFSREVDGTTPISRVVCGEHIAFHRVDGKVYGLQDRCAHRLVPLSMRFECHTAGTVSCWYHGWTYRWNDGVLADNLTDPKCDLIDKLAIKAYPVEEMHGLFFVYIGDATPPPLTADLPPNFADPRREVAGRYLEIDGNWRLAMENGWDSPHFFVHRDSPYFQTAKINVPLALVPGHDHFERMEYVTGPGPKGIRDNLFYDYEPLFSAAVDGVDDAVKAKEYEGATLLLPDIALWLPVCIEVTNWPAYELTDYEFYTPTDGTHHRYFQLISKVCETDDERAALRHDVAEKWTPTAFEVFNRDDILCRKGMGLGYERCDGWTEETLCSTDTAVIAWRQFVSQFSRGQPISARGDEAGAST